MFLQYEKEKLDCFLDIGDIIYNYLHNNPQERYVADVFSMVAYAGVRAPQLQLGTSRSLLICFAFPTLTRILLSGIIFLVPNFYNFIVFNCRL